MRVDLSLTMFNTATIELEGEQLKLYMAYDAAFLEDFKEAITYASRRWDREKKVWYVHPSCGRKLLRILQGHRYSVCCDTAASLALRRYITLSPNELTPDRVGNTPSAVKQKRKISLETE